MGKHKGGISVSFNFFSPLFKQVGLKTKVWLVDLDHGIILLFVKVTS